MSKGKKPYVPRPEIPEAARAKHEALRRVLAGEMSITEAAQQLGYARPYFQELVNQAETALLEVALGKPPGRPKRPESEKALEAENRRLATENSRLRRTTDSLDGILEVTAKWLRHDVQAIQSKRPGPRARPARTSPTPPPAAPPPNEPEEPDPAADPRRRAERLRDARRLLDARVPRRVVAAAVLVGGATLKRWLARSRNGALAFRRPGPGPREPLSEDRKAELKKLVTDMHGRIGAESLRRSVCGVSRRQAATVKAEALTQSERERRAAAPKITVTAPDIVRGFDPVFVSMKEGRGFVMNVQDGFVPFHTSLTLSATYDGPAVRAVLEKDFELNGAPLVLRMDRAKQHVVPEVLELLEAHGVTVLHGPPRHPRFYGQLERQNDEVRRWLNELGEVSQAFLSASCVDKRRILNETWRRGSLGWKTAAEAFQARPRVLVDRHAFREEVAARAAVLKKEESRGCYAGKPERLAIEQALQTRGLLRRELGGWGVR